MAQRRKKPPATTLLYVPYITGKAKVSSRGWVVIPKDIRDELDITPGDELSSSLLRSRGVSVPTSSLATASSSRWSAMVP